MRAHRVFRWSTQLLGAGCLGVLLGCLPAERINRSCEWREPPGATHGGRTHLVEDVRVAQDLGIRFGDSVGGRIWNEANRRAREECTEASFASIARTHGVSQAEIASLVGSRDSWFDILAVFVPMLFVGALAAPFIVRRAIAGYDADDRLIPALVLLVVTPLAAAALLVLAQVWSVVVESLRLRSEHISYRAGELPLYQYQWHAWAIGLALCGAAAAHAWRRQRRPPVNPGARSG